MHMSSIFKEYGIPIDKTKLVRHNLINEDISRINWFGMIECYQATQGKNFFDKCKYIHSFLSTNSTESLFIG
ncbi:hypothetical protein BXO88_10800 [Oribacterium sp. C9]|nr:hypothetical protein BXO88_10800 [Oribacterium sp. C9]